MNSVAVFFKGTLKNTHTYHIKYTMKCKNITAIASILSLAAVASAQDISSSFVNLNFDSTTQEAFPGGFDMSGKDVPGWQNLTTITDSGVQGQGAWWNPYQGYAAFAKSGEGAFDLSTYTIQAGDVFNVDVMAKSWQYGSPGQLTISLFYGSNPNQNLIGSFNTGNLPQSPTETLWTSYGQNIAATVGSVGQTLGISILSSGAGYANFDPLSVTVVPEPTTMALMALGGSSLLLWRRRQAK